MLIVHYLAGAMDLISQNISQIRALCDQYHVRYLFAFGSSVRNDLKAGSDVDFLVDFESSDPIIYSDNYFALKFNLQQLFDRPIDLLEMKALSNQFIKQRIDQTKVLVYGRGN